jgi:enamine deaminase RidA (YjgF/YER057c/UK114 family)
MRPAPSDFWHLDEMVIVVRGHMGSSSDIQDRASINPRRVSYFGDNRPVSTLVEISALVDPRLKVEIECQAFIADLAD